MEQTDYASIPWDAKHDRLDSQFLLRIRQNYKRLQIYAEKKLLAKTSHVGPTKVHQT